MQTKRIATNTVMLMIFNIAKILFPFFTLPYLTRVLSTDTYGSVTYVKTVMTYMQILVDFGFVLSATKDIVKVREHKTKMGYVIGDTMIARIILGIIGFIIIIVLCFILPILRDNMLYTILSYIVVFESIFLMDFLFRGIERMHVITVRFILMKTISTILTFILIKNDADMMLIPILDIISSLVAVLLVFWKIKKMHIKMYFSKIQNAFKSIKESFIYFISNVASTSFNALSTIIIGIHIGTTEVAYWGVCMQIIGSIQACYTPLSDGIYPEMIKSKNINLIKKILKIFLPLVIIGCILVYFLAEPVFLILGGEEYLNAVPIFRLLIPALFFGFLVVLFGWPTLGAIGKTKETTLSTVISIIAYIFMLGILLFINKFTLINLAIARSLTEFILFITRYMFYIRYRKLFNKE